MNEHRKHAYLIMAHNKPEHLKILLQLIDDKRNDIYIHWDKKSPELDKDWLLSNIKNSNVFFTQRMSVTWAGYSQLECQMMLWEDSHSKSEYGYYHLLSGIDLPIKTQDEIHQFFVDNAGTEYVHLAEHEEAFVDRLKYYYFFQEIYGRNHRSIYPGGLFVADIILLSLQKLFKVNRLKDEPFRIYKGANWCSITHELVSYILSNRGWIEKRCKLSRYSDEVALQTLVFNSHFSEKVYTNYNETPEDMGLRKIDWIRGQPYTYTLEDFDMLMDTNCLFARKFDIEESPEIVKKIEATISERQKDK